MKENLVVVSGGSAVEKVLKIKIQTSKGRGLVCT